MAVDFLDEKKQWKKAKWWYCLHFDGKIGAIVDYNDGGRGTSGLCMIFNKDSDLKAGGYILPINEVKPYKNQCQKDKRSF